MFGDVGRSTAVFTAERETLQQAQADQNDRSSDADGRCIRQQANDEGRQTHDEDRDKERILAADDVADSAEHQRAERTDKEAGGEGEQRKDVTGAWRIGAEELRADDRGQRTVKIEIVPFENGTERRSDNDETFVLGHPFGLLPYDCGRHERAPLC